MNVRAAFVHCDWLIVDSTTRALLAQSKSAQAGQVRASHESCLHDTVELWHADHNHVSHVSRWLLKRVYRLGTGRKAA